MYYYEIHVFFSREDGYSFAIKSDRTLSDDEAIERAEYQYKFTEDGDQHHVDYVLEITEEEYLTNFNGK